MGKNKDLESLSEDEPLNEESIRKALDSYNPGVITINDFEDDSPIPEGMSEERYKQLVGPMEEKIAELEASGHMDKILGRYK